MLHAVKFSCPIDRYNEKSLHCWPILTDTPRKGDMIEVTPQMKSYFKNLGLPIALEVKKVTWTSDGAVCELWFSEHDCYVAKEKNISLLSL